MPRQTINQLKAKTKKTKTFRRSLTHSLSSVSPKKMIVLLMNTSSRKRLMMIAVTRIEISEAHVNWITKLNRRRTPLTKSPC